MKLKVIFLILLFIFSIQLMSAWNRQTHDYLCLENDSINCNIADILEFQQNNPRAITYFHLCYDNKEDCMAKLSAKYFLKQYYVGGEINKDFLGAAAHLIQDSKCPLHWYSGYKILGKDIFIFTPKQIKKIEDNVELRISIQEQNWSIPVKYKGEDINVNENYLNNIKTDTEEFLSQEPEETLEELESKIKSRKLGHYLRAYQSIMILLFIILIPILGYSLWKYKKDKKISMDLIVPALVFLIIIILFILMKIFY